MYAAVCCESLKLRRVDSCDSPPRRLSLHRGIEPKRGRHHGVQQRVLSLQDRGHLFSEYLAVLLGEADSARLQYRAERFYPSYYDAGRPQPAGLPSTITYGGSLFNLSLPDSSFNGSENLESVFVGLMRTGFSTHAMKCAFGWY